MASDNENTPTIEHTRLRSQRLRRRRLNVPPGTLLPRTRQTRDRRQDRRIRSALAAAARRTAAASARGQERRAQRLKRRGRSACWPPYPSRRLPPAPVAPSANGVQPAAAGSPGRRSCRRPSRLPNRLPTPGSKPAAQQGSSRDRRSSISAIRVRRGIPASSAASSSRASRARLRRSIWSNSRT